jgi:hypothetical protein
VLAALTLDAIPVAFADDLTGQASVIDGDTLEIHGAGIRVWGVDAPESNQLCRGDDSLQYRCGAKAANDLDAFIAGRPVNCLPISLNRYGRTVVTCSVGGADLGDWLVRNGLGRSIQSENTSSRSVTPNKPGRGCGQAATSSRGYIEYVSGRAEFRPIARTTPMLILENGGDRPAQSLFEHRGSCRRTLPADPCLLSPTSALERITDSSQTSCQVRNVPTRDSCTAAMAAFNAPGTCDDCGGHVESDRSPREGHQSHGSFKPCVNFFP